MVSKILTLGYAGLETFTVEAEVDVHRGLPAVALVGLLDTAVRESRDRVRSAVKNSGFTFPAQRITVNLAPAHIKKEGTHFDLAIALGLMNASHQALLQTADFIILGELSLQGEVRPVRGIFPMALHAKRENKKLIVPAANANEASLVRGLEVYAVKSLSDAVSFLSGMNEKPAHVVDGERLLSRQDYGVDFSEVKGQLCARRALEVAAAGMHNLLLIGPPGVGKTMLTRRMPTILPDMEWEEILEVTRIYSVAGCLDKDQPLMKIRPYRSPHHTASAVSLVGGGAAIRPGEVTLAHRGVLFCDELAEFRRDSLEGLRQPLEDGVVNISRAKQQVQYPCRFLFIGAMNPCPCGYFGSNSRACHCGSYQIQKYRNKISGPLLDRIDIHVELPELKSRDLLAEGGDSEASACIKGRVEAARAIQRDRFHREKIFFNSQMSPQTMRAYCTLGPEAKTILAGALEHFRFSARAHDKILRVSRTIADLAGSEAIGPEHISEAVQYRSLDKNLWV